MYGLSGRMPWDPWWRILLYVLCSVSVLGQYRFIIMNYWAGLIVQVAAYVAQESVKTSLASNHEYDGMNRVFGDVTGAMASVVTACCVALTVDYIRCQSRVGVSSEGSAFSKSMHYVYKYLVQIGTCLGLGRGLTGRAAEAREALEGEAKALNKRPSEIVLSPEHESTLVEDAVEAQEYNFWSLLMPAVYQLVPGSQLAMYWYNIIFPPQPFEDPISTFLNQTEDFDEVFDSKATRPPRSEVVADSAAYALWLTSLSLALGLILGLAVVRIAASAIVNIYSACSSKTRSEHEENMRMDSFKLRQFGRQELTHQDCDNDPDDIIDLSVSTETNGEGLRHRKNQTPDTMHSPQSTEWDV